MTRAGLFKRFLTFVVLGFACLCACQVHAETTGTLRIGYQRYGTLIIAKERGTLEKRLNASGWKVEWDLFVGGPQLLEALAAGAIDLGITGETPPVFAQAAGSPVVYVAVEPPAPDGEAIVLPPGSDIKSVADLRGHKVALNKGSNVHWLLLAALQKAGLSWSDITPVYLSPADAPAAFAARQVDAWAIWDPYLSAAQTNLGAKILITAEGLVPNRQFFIAHRNLVANHPDILNAVLAEVANSDAWASAHHPEVAALLAASANLPQPVVRRAVDRLAFGPTPLGPQQIADQQKIADAFAAAGLIPSKISIKDAVWQPSN